MSNMTDIINAAESIFTSNMSINHTFIGNYQDFIAEDYPAICLEPDTTLAQLNDSLAFDYDDTGALNVYYVEQAPEDRIMTTFITKIDSIVAMLKNHPQLDGILNSGINITAKYMRRTTEDNIEFIALIKIEGRTI